MGHQIKKQGLLQITPESFTISSSVNQVEPVPSAVLDRANHKAQSQSRSPNCALCQNHGKAVRTKAHKRYCPWKDCRCSKCDLTKNRRKVVASQIAARRALKQDQEREMMETESRDCDADKDVKVFPKPHNFSLNKTLEKYYIKLSASRESSHSTSSQGSHTESVSSSSSSFDSREYLRKHKSSTLNFDFSRRKSTATSTQSQESIQTPNKMFCVSLANEYPIYRIWRDFGGDYKLAAAKIFESMYGNRSQTQVEDSLRLYSAPEQFASPYFFSNHD